MFSTCNNTHGISHYYPYGMLIDGGAQEVQPFKYYGKELDRMNGLNWYDHGARMSDPALGRWHVMDPLCEKYYDVSPYVYCHANPVNRIDPDGRDDVYSIDGQYLYHIDNKTDHIMIHDNVTACAEWNKNTITRIEDMELSAETYSNILTDILSKMEGVGKVDVSKLHNGKVSVAVIDPSNRWRIKEQYNDAGREDANASTDRNHSDAHITAYIRPDNKDLFSTISNVQHMLGKHEYGEHFMNNIPDGVRLQNRIMKGKLWERTTKEYKQHEYDLLQYYKSKEKRK